MGISFYKHSWTGSLLIVIVTVLIASFILFPLFNSGDDVYCMYTLSGSYGDAPSALLHFDYGWHPILGNLVKFLFIQFPGINWYTITLLSFQVIALTIILHFLLETFQFPTALIFYLILIVFIQIPAIQSLNYTFTSWILASAALLLILRGSRLNKKSFLITGTLLLLIAGLFRVHVFLAVIILFLPAFFLYSLNHFIKWGACLLMAGGLLFALNLQQKAYYKKQIPGWARQEEIRQSLFYIYNRPANKVEWNQVFRDSTEAVIFLNHYYYDSTGLPLERIKEIGKKITRVRDFSQPEDRQVFYWLFIGLRVYMLLFGILLLIIWRAGGFSGFLRKFLIPLCGIVLTYLYLQLFLKITLAIHLGLLLLLFIHLVLAIDPIGIGRYLKRKQGKLISLLLLLPLLWMISRIKNDDALNRTNHQRYLCTITDLKSHPQLLFAAIDDNLPLNYFYIWNDPSRFKMVNVLFKDRMMTQHYASVLERFKISDLSAEFYKNETVRLIANDPANLVLLFRFRYHEEVIADHAAEKYACLPVWQLSAPK